MLVRSFFEVGWICDWRMIGQHKGVELWLDVELAMGEDKLGFVLSLFWETR